MKYSRTTIVTTAVLAVAAAAAAGGVTIAATAGNSSTTYGWSATGSHAASANRSPDAVISTTTASVQGTSERILVNAKGDPLYFYKPDTATKSLVAGQLAVLWPPLVGGSATVKGAAGAVTTVPTTNGQQVAYNGHFLYTFVEDKPGQVTGQGVQDFFVATPGLSSTSGSDAGMAPGPAASSY
jgi:predicted lipoprotein with Yx(FWY)xxD motif